MTPNGRLASDAQTAYSLAIAYALFDAAEQRLHAGDRLRALVLKSQLKIATGFVGTPLICDALTDTGHVDAAYGLLMQEECPSWLYPVLHGATTIWERWDAILPSGRVNEAGIGMISFNHYAFGAVADWLHRVVGGLAPAAPGWRELRIAPQPGGGLTSATSRLDTPYGFASSAWEIAGRHGHRARGGTAEHDGTRRPPGHHRRVRSRIRAHSWTVAFEPPAALDPTPNWGELAPDAGA